MTRFLPCFLLAAALAIGVGCNGHEVQSSTPDSPAASDEGQKPANETADAAEPAGEPKAAPEQPGQAHGAPANEKRAAEPQPQPGTESPRQPGGSRPGGQQGYGGGMWGGGGASLALREDVRKEIDLTDDQVEKLRTKVREILPQGGPSAERPNVNAEEIAKKMDSAVKSVLTPAQVKRLEELELQRSGPAALANKEVAQKVGITEETRAKIEKLVSDHQAKLRGMGGPPGSPEEAQKRQEEARMMREKLRTDILALLDANQKAKWEALLGKPFEFQQRRQGGGQQRPQAGGGRGA